MKKLLLTALSFLITFIPYILYAEEYSLSDLWELALKRSEIIKIAEEDLNISESGKHKAAAALLPTLSAFGSHTRYTEEKSRLSFTLQPQYTNSWGLRLDQSFSLSGREVTDYRISKLTVLKSSLNLEAVKSEYLINIASAYYDALKSAKALEIARANVERLKKHRDTAQVRLDVGEVTKTDLLRSEAELAGAQSELIKAENMLRLAKAILARKAGIAGSYDLIEKTISVDQGSLSAGCQLSLLVCLKKRAYEEREEIKALRMQKKIAEGEVGLAKGSYWPSLSIEGVYSREENEPSSSFSLDERIYGLIKLDFPFFEGGLRKAEVREAEARLKQSEYSLLDYKKTLGVEVENSYLDLLTTSGIIAKLEAEVEYSKDNYNAVSKQFIHGLSDSIDVIDANTLLVTAEKELANEKYNYQLAFLKLRRVTGVLLKTVINREPAASDYGSEDQ